MEQLYHASNSIVADIQQCFKRYETATGSDASDTESTIQAMMSRLMENCERLSILANKEPIARRQTVKMRVDELKYEHRHLNAAFSKLQRQRYEREEALRSREELLSRKFSPNSNQDTSIFIDQSLQFHSRATDANRQMDDLISHGGNVLTNLKEQRGTLKGAHRKMLDVVNTLGMSNTVMRLIEKRTYQDKFILFGGMLVTCVIMFLVVKYLT
ncbi:Golgi SNAP receptor complex member 2-like [Ornithodoros turicata]|uniref:Golgi SNAP receptor complex member 2-like n=1 Tax=Ornithodoros turicata TaxID=34597 RepID=UPI00313905F7